MSVATCTGRTACRSDSVDGVGGHVLGPVRAADEAGDVAGNRLDVGFELSVVLLVVGGMVADDVDDRRVRLAGVVQVGEPVAESWTEMEQRRGGPFGHAGVAVGGTGGDSLEEGEHAAHLGHVVEGSDEVHLGRAGVHEAHVDATVDQRADQRLCADHACGPIMPGLLSAAVAVSPWGCATPIDAGRAGARAVVPEALAALALQADSRSPLRWRGGRG